MKKLFEVFDHVYIINLPARTDRRNETVAEFRRNQMNVPNSKIDFFEASRPATAEGFPTLGTRGLFLSVLRILEHASKHEFERIAIVEDDILLNRVDPTLIEALSDDLLGTDWSIASLGYLRPSEPRRDRLGLAQTDEPILGTQFWAVRGPASMLALRDYLELAASRAPGHPEGGPMHLDGAINMARSRVSKLDFRIATESIASQRRSRTDIHATGPTDKLWLIRDIKGLLRMLLNFAERK